MRVAALLLLSAMAFTATAQTAPAADGPADAHAAPVADATADVPAEAEPAVAAVDAFGKALAAGDLQAVESLLDPQVLILESGGAEQDRAEYLGHHAIADARFLKDAHVQTLSRRARVNGDLAWVATESELHATDAGKPVTLLGTETMVLHWTRAGWQIVHIHWSSRPKKP